MTGDVPADAAEAFGRAQRFPDAAAGGFVYAVGGSPDDPRFYRMTPAGRWVDTIDTLPRGAVENGVSSQILYWNDDDRPHVASVTAPDGQRYATGAGGILRVRADGSLEPLTAEERAALPPEVGTRLLRQAAGPMLAMPDGVNGPFRRCTTCAPSRTPSRLGDLQPDEVERIQRVVERLSRDVRSEFPDHGVPVEISVVGSAARGARRNPGREDLPIGHDPVGRPGTTRSDIDYVVPSHLEDFFQTGFGTPIERLPQRSLPSFHDFQGAPFAGELRPGPAITFRPGQPPEMRIVPSID